MINRISFVFIAVVFLSSCHNGGERAFLYLDGFTQGTSYYIAYNSPDSIDYHEDIKELFAYIDNSMSIYNPGSVISAVNRSEPGIRPDDYFVAVFERAMEISEKTGGAFDITVGPLVNAWGFGFTERENITPELVDSILGFTGWHKVRLEDGLIVKDDERIMLDMNAIAKGYTVDVVARFFDSRGINDYMIEVGGEIRVKGTNRNDQLWRIGIDKPVDDPAAMSRELQEVLHLTGASLATSGNYRRFYIEDGQRFAHTIDPSTGYPVRHNLLSATVVTTTAMDADAFATAFMVMGLEESMEFASSHPDIEAYFIYDINGMSAVAHTDGIKDMIRR